jgi:hypothetical protein
VNRPNLFFSISAGFLVFWMLACASKPPPYVPPPPSKWYDINSTPAGATVKLDGAVMGTTPVRFNRLGNATLSIEKSGYQTIESGLSEQTSPSLHFQMEKLAPTTFTRTMEATWAGIEARPELGFENAWNATVDLLTRRFDLEVISKDNGYIRTNWLYTWTGVMSEDYRVRVTIKFSPDHRKLDVKSEAQFHTNTGWVLGTDEALLQTLKTDIMGSVGRSTR